MIDLTREWLLNSGIQNINKDKKTNGGFNSWYDIDKRTYPFIYSEITGYGITTLLYMNKNSKEEILIDRTKLAADWLITNAYGKCGGIKTRYFLDDKSFRNQEMYVFDAGMILYGIVNLFKVTKIPKYLDAGKNIANFLLKCQKQNGLFYAIYDAEKDAYIDKEGKWSTQSGSYHAKVAMALIDMFNITKEEAYRKAAMKICHASIKLQKRDGRFISLKENGDTHLHPHSYSAEGLLYVGDKLNNNEYILSAVKACEWALKNQLSNGGIPYYYENNGHGIPYERVDVLAQTLRLGCLLYSMKRLEEKYVDNLKRLKDRLCEFQITKGAKEEKGAFFFGTDYDGNQRNHANSWCSMFAFQALDMYERAFKNRENISTDLLI